MISSERNLAKYVPIKDNWQDFLKTQQSSKNNYKPFKSTITHPHIVKLEKCIRKKKIQLRKKLSYSQFGAVVCESSPTSNHSVSNFPWLCLSPSQNHSSLSWLLLHWWPEKLPNEPSTSWEIHIFFKLLFSMTQGEKKYSWVSTRISRGGFSLTYRAFENPKLQSDKTIHSCYHLQLKRNDYRQEK